MALCSVLISIPLAFLTSLFWAFQIGGSFLQFLLVYAVSGQIAFVLALLALILADHLRRQKHAARDVVGLSFDKLA